MIYQIKTWLGLGAIIFAFSLNGIAQADADLVKYSEKFPDQKMVTVNSVLETTINIEQGELKVSEERIEERFFLTDQVGFFAEDAISYNYFSTIESIDARSYIPNKKKYKVEKVRDFTEKDEFTSGIFFDDIKSINFKYPGLQRGAKSYLKYNESQRNPRFTSSGYFISSYPVENQEFIVRFHEDVQVEYKVFNDEDSKLKFEETQEGSFKVLKWSIKDLDATDFESNAPPVQYWAPHVIIYIKSYEVDGEEKHVLRDVGDLFGWYNELLGEMEELPNDNLKSIVDSITIDATSDEEKLKKIFYWTQSNIKYVAVENGLGGFIPRVPQDVCDKRYGDCKDMASLIHEMSTLAGVETYITWIGSRDIPYSYSDVPTPLVDNHMICAYRKGDEMFFLDATGRYIDFLQPTAFIQGKEALIKTGDDAFEIHEVQTTSSSENKISESLKITLDDEKITGTSNVEIDGYYKGYFLGSTASLIDQDKNDFYRSYFEKGSNKFIIKDFKEADRSVRDAPLNFEYSFDLKDYVVASGDELILNMNFEKFYSEDVIEEDRTLPREYQFKSLVELETLLEIPDAYEVTYIPENSEFEKDEFSYKFTYQMQGKDLVLKQQVWLNTLMIQNNDFKSWNTMIKQMKKCYKDSVVLKKKKE